MIYIQKTTTAEDAWKLDHIKWLVLVDWERGKRLLKTMPGKIT